MLNKLNSICRSKMQFPDWITILKWSIRTADRIRIWRSNYLVTVQKKNQVNNYKIPGNTSADTILVWVIDKTFSQAVVGVIKIKLKILWYITEVQRGHCRYCLEIECPECLQIKHSILKNIWWSDSVFFIFFISFKRSDRCPVRASVLHSSVWSLAFITVLRFAAGFYQ